MDNSIEYVNVNDLLYVINTIRLIDSSDPVMDVTKAVRAMKKLKLTLEQVKDLTEKDEATICTD